MRATLTPQSKIGGSRWVSHTPAQSASPIPSGDTQLTEVAEVAGLGAATSGGDTHGVAIGFFDVDGDGWADVFLVNGRNPNTGTTHTSELWPNNQDGSFSEVTATAGIDTALDSLSGSSISAADYDADGDLDILVTGNPTDRFLQNDGNGVHTDVSAVAGIGGDPTDSSGNGSKIGSWGDVDNDGWLDIAVVSAQFVSNAQPENGYLMHNNGDGTFTDITTQTGLQISDQGNPCALMWSDFDNDGDQDLHVWNDRGNSGENRTLLQNNGGTFTDITTAAGWSNALATNPMGVDGADVNLDYYIGNIGGSLLMMGSAGDFFLDASTSAGVRGEYTWGLGFEDFNLDGWWDIFMAQEEERDYLTFTNEQVSPVHFSEQRWQHGPWEAEVTMSPWPSQTTTTTATPTSSRVEPVAIGPTCSATTATAVARFGLGDWDGANWVAVLWPDGRQQVIRNVPGDQVLVLP